MNNIKIIAALIFFLMVSRVMAQTPDFQIDTKASGSVNVCGNAITFTVTITKLNGSSVQNIKLFPQMPAGMTYVAGTAAGMSEVTPVNPVNASFTLTDFTGQKTVTFQGKADCSLIASLQATGSSSNLINNDTKLTYMTGGADKELLETNGSESYSVLYPELELFVPEAEKNMGAPFINVVMSRHITAKNTGLGSITSFDFYLKTEPELTLDKLELQTASGSQVITSSSVTALGRKYTITDFTGVGDGDAYFEENELIHFTDYVKATTSKGSIETIYTAQWGCNNAICNANDTQSSFAAYVEAIGGKPNVVFGSYPLTRSDLCNDPPRTVEYTFTNNGFGNDPATRDAAFNVSWFYGLNGYNTQNNFHFSIRKDDKSLVNIDYLLNYTESSYPYKEVFSYYNKYYRFDLTDKFSYDPDGTGGLDDVDGDGFYDDLPSGATLTIFASQKVTFTADVQTFAGEPFLNNEVGLYYYSWAGEFGNTGLGFQLFAPFLIDQDLIGPADLVNGKTEAFKLSINASQYDSWFHETRDATFEIDINVPDGVVAKSAKLGTTNLAFTQQGRQIKIINALYGALIPYTIDLEFALDCSKASGAQVDNIAVDMYYYSDPTCSTTRFKIAQLQKPFYLHCGLCASTETTQFTAERTTLGWVPPVYPKIYYTYGELFGSSPNAKKVTRNTSGIRLDAAYPKDEVETVIQGRVAALTNNLSAEIKYTSKLSLEMLQYESASFSVNGTTYTLPPDYRPFKVAQLGTYTYTYNIPLGTPGWPAQLAAGTVFELKVKHKVDDLTGIKKGEYPLSEFRGRFFSTVNGTPTGCVGFGDDFSLLRPIFENEAGNFNYNLDKNNKITLATLWGSWTNDSYTLEDFPGEYRPLNYLNSATVTLPKGFIFDTSKPIEFTSDYYSIVNTLAASPNYSPDKRTITLPVSDNTPIGKIMVYYYAHVLIDCNPDNAFEPVTSPYDLRYQSLNYSYRYYSYLPSASSHGVKDAGSFQIGIFNLRRPDLRLTANSIQEGYSDKVNWPVQVCSLPNSTFYEADALHTWLAFELKSDDTSTVLESVLDENDKLLPIIFYGPKDASHPKGRNILIKMDTISIAQCAQIKIVASYKNCEADKIQDVNVYSSWDYYSYPDVTNYTGSIVNHKASCEGNLLTETASIKYKTAALQWEITKATDSVNMCTPVPFDIDLASTLYGDMRDLKVWIDLPPYASIDGSASPKFIYPFNGSPRDIPNEAYLNQSGKLGFDITKILGGNLPGVRLAGNKVRLAFNVTTSCGFDPGLPIKYTVNGYTNCGDFVEYVDQRKIKLLGVSLDTLDLQITAPPTITCNSENEISLSLKNPGKRASSTSQLEIVLPQGTQFKEIVGDDLPTPTVSNVNGVVKLQWSLPLGYLNPAEEKSFSIITFLGQTPAGVTRVSFTARTFKLTNANCSDSTSITCVTQATSGLSELSVPVNGLASLRIGNQKYVCAYKFSALINEGNCALGNYTWDFGDGATSLERSPFHSFSQPGTYNVSVNVDFTCGGCGGSQSTQIQLTVNPQDALLQDTLIHVLTDAKQQVLQVSASTFSDSWPSQHVNPSLSKRSGYLNGTLGVWRNEGAFVYNVPRSASTNPNLSKDGTFSLDQFNWDLAELDAIPGWVRANTMTQYSPYSYELENRDVMGIYSAALYDYGGHLPSANGVNMRNSEMAFTGFEFLDGGASGNWIFGVQPLPNYFLYDLNSAKGNAAVVKASMEDLDGVDKVDVAAKGRSSIINLFYPLIGIMYNYINEDEIVCKIPYPPHPQWTIIILKQAPFSGFWSGRIKVHNDVVPAMTPDIDNTFAHSGKSSLKITSEKIFKQNLLQLDSGAAYMLSGWVSVKKADVTTPKLADDLGIDVTVRDKHGNAVSVFSIIPSGPVIEGWQQVRGTFKFPAAKGASMELKFKPGSTGSAWYDDLRLHPEKGNMKSYVYDLKDYRLRAILDEENFASFYYYDEEGNLYLVKKETEAGVKTISENVSSLKQK